MINTLADVALELNSRYADIVAFSNKGERGKIFNSILRILFNEFGQQFGLEDFSSFRSSVVQVKNNLKRTKQRAQKNLELRCGINQDSPLKLKKGTTSTSNFRRHFHRPKEGDGEVYTEWQVEFYGLNADSY